MSRLLTIDGINDALPALFRYEVQRRKAGGVICLTGGTGRKTGAGKSYTARRMGEILDPRFSIDDVALSYSELLKRIDYIEDEGKYGRFVVAEESEVMMASHDYQRFGNKAIAQTLQTFRYLRCWAIVITPYFGWLDARVRKLVNYWGVCSTDVGDEGKLEGHLKFYTLRTDLMGEQLYPRRLTFWDKQTNAVVRADAFKIGAVSPDLEAAYQAKDIAFKKHLRKDLLDEALRIEAQLSEPAKKMDLVAVAEDFFSRDVVQQHLAAKHKINVETVMRANRDLSEGFARTVARLINQMYEEKQHGVAPTLPA